MYLPLFIHRYGKKRIFVAELRNGVSYTYISSSRRINENVAIFNDIPDECSLYLYWYRLTYPYVRVKLHTSFGG